MALQREGIPHARCVVLIEACGESGSFDLPHYIDHLVDRIGEPSMVVCLDSGAGNYEQMWLTVSLRGMAAGTLNVNVTNAVPTIALSGDASVEEGSPYSLTLGATSDPGDDTVSEYIIVWDDGRAERMVRD